MGKTKEHYHDEICKGQQIEPGDNYDKILTKEYFKRKKETEEYSVEILFVNVLTNCRQLKNHYSLEEIIDFIKTKQGMTNLNIARRQANQISYLVESDIQEEINIKYLEQ